MTIALGLVVLVAATALDYVYVLYQRAVAGRRSVLSGACSVGLYLIGLVGSLSVLQESRWYIIPECVGLFVGTVLAVRRQPVLAR